MRKFIAMLAFSVLMTVPAFAQISVHIGINVPSYPDLRVIPGYPVYYAPRMQANYFFYDGLYWVYTPDGWFVSYWYNGPWEWVPPDEVPFFMLRVPVRYYLYAPPMFQSWSPQAPPRWEVLWGGSWSSRHRGWNEWNRSAVPAPAPLPTYQRAYANERYPDAVERQQLQQKHYRYKPRDPVARKHFQTQRAEDGPARANVSNTPQQRRPDIQDAPRAARGESREKDVPRHKVERDEERARAASAPAPRMDVPREPRREPSAPQQAREQGHAPVPHPAPRAQESQGRADGGSGKQKEKQGKHDKDEDDDKGRRK